MTTKIYLHLFLLCIFLWAGCFYKGLQAGAQGNSCFMISAMGASNSSVRMLSYPIIVNFSANCLLVDSGVPLWDIPVNSGNYIYPCLSRRSLVSIDLRIFPNPTRGSVIVQGLLFEDLDQSAHVLVYNKLGQLTFSTPIQLIDLQQGLSIELHSFPSGVYTVVVVGELIRGTGKIIKIND